MAKTNPVEKVEMHYNQTRNSAPSLREEGQEPLVPHIKEHIYDIRISARTKTQKAMVYIVPAYMVISVIGSAIF